jgi:O-antigen/teichoic acid export membrane protein
VVVSLFVIGFLARLTRRGAAKGFDFTLLKRMLVYGLKFYACIFAGFIIFRLDLLIVNRFRGAQDAGVYAIASQFSFLLIMLPGVIASLLFPRVASRKEPAAYAVDVTRHTSFIMLIVCLGGALASFALPLVYGARFADATIQFLILLPGVFFISLESVLVQYFTGTGLPAIIPWFWIITVAVNLGLNLAFVPAFGARAAAINSTVSYALICFLVVAYFGRQTGLNPLLVFAPRVHELRTLITRLQRRAFAK